MKMQYQHWNRTKKPSLEMCPEHYCFCWVPPGGKADLSGREYDSFEEAIEGSKNGVLFLKGGCAAPFGLCRRGTRNMLDKDCYEPSNSCLKKSNLPELFFCNPESLDDEGREEYRRMAQELWRENA